MYRGITLLWKTFVYSLLFILVFQVYTLKRVTNTRIIPREYAVVKANITKAKNELSKEKRELIKTKSTHNNKTFNMEEPAVIINPEDKETSNINVEAVNKLRQTRLKQACNSVQKVHNRRKLKLRMVMNKDHSITYCRVNKVASTYTMDLLTQLFKCSEDCIRQYAYEIQNLPYFDFRRAVAKSFKFTFVREPYGRLFSTYSNKFYFPKEHWSPIGPTVVKRYRTNPSKDSLTYGHNITFAEMIRFTVEEYEAKRRMDEHLRPMNSHCNPCEYDYDFIGKLETLDTDWNYLKQFWLKTNKITEIPDPKNQTVFKFPDLKHILLTFDVIKDSTISKYKLYLRAWTYYQMCGYIYKYIDMPFKPTTHIRFADFEAALKEAKEKSKPYVTQTKQQKTEALKQAYASIPYSLLLRLKKVVHVDCKLFDYDCNPDWVFKGNDQQTDFNYFRGLE